MEIIMAVGLLSLVSVYTLQIYVTAHRLNQQTIDMDESIQTANTVMQLVDGSSRNELALHPFFEQANFAFEGDTVEIQQWYNEKWMTVDGKEVNEDQTIYHTVQVNIEPHQLDGLWHVTVKVNRVKPYLLRQEEYTDLYRLSVLRYLPEWEVASQ